MVHWRFFFSIFYHFLSPSCEISTISNITIRADNRWVGLARPDPIWVNYRKPVISISNNLENQAIIPNFFTHFNTKVKVFLFYESAVEIQCSLDLLMLSASAIWNTFSYFFFYLLMDYLIKS